MHRALFMSVLAWLCLTVRAPALDVAGAAATSNRAAVVVRFDARVADDATNAANYALSGGLPVLGATLDATFSNVTLQTGLQAPWSNYTVTVTGVHDRATSNLTAGGASAAFTGWGWYGPQRNVPASAAWTLLYTLMLPGAADYNTTGVPYALDHSPWVTNFSRVAYYLELQPTNGGPRFVWVAMDAFSRDPAKVGVPAAGTGASFQLTAAHVEVLSGGAGIAAATNPAGVQIHFVPTNGGVMQVTGGTGQVLFACNGWGGGTMSAGIGALTNVGAFPVKRLLVYVLPDAVQDAVEADLVVYGGTSGGVAASVQAARMGKRAVLLCYDNHLGGLSSGGLGATDTGNAATIGGISREFYRRIGLYYGTGDKFTFEPRVAEQVFTDLLLEAGVPVVFQQRLASVTMNGNRIHEIVSTAGRVFRGKMFLDATYEGDLLAAAGVGFTVGRESTAAYGESLNGIRASTPSHQFVANVDPYVVPGNPGSGLLPLIQPGDGGTPGDGDERVQAYNFRMCMTTTATNKLPILPPDGYDAARYELLGRYVSNRVANGDALTIGSFMNPSTMPRNKTDANNNGAFSTDFIGMNYDYPTNTQAARDVTWRAHEEYIRGFFRYLGSDARIPANVRNSMLNYGLSLDEFIDTGGWPHAMYVREGRRMISDYIMTQANCNGSRYAADSVGLASYTMDSHNCQRVVQGGYVRNEGDVQQSPAGPFPISYRSIVPGTNACRNLFATFALSGTHIAFSSCRMEPVFMMTSQSAGTAACFAIDDGVDVQDVDYARLALQLLADRQILAWGAAAAETNGIIVDNTDETGVAIVGDWLASASVTGYWGANYLHDDNANKGTKSVTYTPALPTAAVYQVYARWTANANRATNAPFDIVHPGGTNTFLVNQRVGGDAWNLLFATNFNAGTNARVVIRTTPADGGYVIADAIRFVWTGAPPPAVTLQVVATDPVASEWGVDPARFTFVRTGDSNVPITVGFTLGGTAAAGSDYAATPGAIVLPAGVIATSLVITAVDDDLVEGLETLTLALQPGTNYAVGTHGAAAAAIRDATPPPPVLTGGQPGGPGSFLVSGTNGVPGASFYVRSTTNLLAPPSAWPVLQTNVFDAAGRFLFTNAIGTNSPHRFYRIQFP